VWHVLTGFMLGQTMIAALDASCIALGALLLGVPEVGAIFTLTFIAAYIPFIGAFVAGAMACLLAVSEGGIDLGIAMLVVVLVVQQVESNVFQPWIQGRSVRVHPLVVALAVVLGGAIAGFLGVFLAVPVAASAIVTAAVLRDAGILPGPHPGAPPAPDSPRRGGSSAVVAGEG
jgi:predicted PurR-regulated permease PerM